VFRSPMRLAGRAAIAIGSGLLAVGLLDVALRLRAPLCTESFGLFRPDPWVGWTHEPGVRTRLQDCLQVRPEFVTHVETDENGLRDVPRTTTRRAGTVRVLVLGDSFTEGVQVERDETFVARLEALLGERSNAPIEVINAGVAGYGTDNEVLAFEHGLWRFDVDLVLLALSTGNDVYENSRQLITDGVLLTYPDKPYFVRGASGLELEHYPVPPEIAHGSAVGAWSERALASSPLLRLLGWRQVPFRRDVRLIGGRPDAPRSLLEQYLVQDLPDWAEAYALTEALVGRLAAAVARQGARFAIVLVPDKMAVVPGLLDTTFGLTTFRGQAHDALRPHRELNALLERAGVVHLSLLDAFRARAAAHGTPTFFTRDSHWNAAGHALAAERMAPFVRAQLDDAVTRAAHL
jgi:SGNH hydrolase-like domain, acetyltransferase AlgX